MLSKQIKQSYINTIIFVSVVTLTILTLYIMSALFLTIDILFLLLVFIFILMGITAFFSLTFIKLSASYLNQKVRVNKQEVKNIDDLIVETISFGKNALTFNQNRYEKEEIFTIRAYNFKYALISDDQNMNYLISTDDIEVIRD